MKRQEIGLLVALVASCAAPPPEALAPAPVDAGGCHDACATPTDCAAGSSCRLGAQGCAACEPDACSDHPALACRSSAHCCGGQSCRAKEDPPQCGICFRAENECDANRPCEKDFVCVEGAVPGCSCDGTAPMICRPDCRVTACGIGEQCGADHSCRKLPCATDLDCAASQACRQGVGGDANTCVRVLCGTTTKCPERSPNCVNGMCSTALGTCSFPAG